MPAVVWSPIIAALFFVASNVCRIIVYIGWSNRFYYNEADMLDLDPYYIKNDFLWRYNHAHITSAANTLNAMAWVVFTVPMIQVSWVLSRGGVRQVKTHAAIVGLSICAVITEIMSRFLTFGVRSSALWLDNSFNMDTWLPEDVNSLKNDGIGWRDLEITFRVIQGLTTYLDAFEWVCLICILCLILSSVSSMQHRVLSIWWARFGLLVAILCVFDLASSLVVFFDRHTYILFSVGVSIVNTLFFLPTWLLMLAFALPHALPRYVPARTNEMRV